MAKQIIPQVQRFTFVFIAGKLEKERQVCFEELRDAVKAEFPNTKFNWLIAVRSPMQTFINAGKMKRDMTDLKIERYLSTI